ncbi:MAG TPA: PAS domain S-box protein, partial [Acidimicrobiales bacterium]|nr:PAS domain S-box protein [Acidimicrobiales bacterium]
MGNVGTRAAEELEGFGEPVDILGKARSDAFRVLCMDNLLSNAAESIYFKDRLSRFLLVSKKFLAEYTQLPRPDELYGLTDADLFSPEHASEAFADEQQIIETGEPLVRKLERETFEDAPDEWVETTKMPLRDYDGQVIGTFGITRNITEEYRAMTRQAALAKVGDAMAVATSRAQIYEALLSGALSVLIERVARAAVVVTGGLALAVAAQTSEPVSDPSLLETTKSVLDEVAHLTPRPPVVRRGSLLVLPLGGVGQAPLPGAHSEAASLQLLGALVLETERDLSEHSLAALIWLVTSAGVILDSLVTARRLRSLVSRASDGLVVITSEGTVRFGAESLLRTLGYRPAQVIGRSVADLVHREDLEKVATAVTPEARTNETVLEVRWRHADGSWRVTETQVTDLSADPEVQGFALSIRDVTERKSLEMELRQAQKLQAIGQLAGGV